MQINLHRCATHHAGGSKDRLTETSPNTLTRTLLGTTGKFTCSLGQDQCGELYLVDYNGGNIFKIVAQ